MVRKPKNNKRSRAMAARKLLKAAAAAAAAVPQPPTHPCPPQKAVQGPDEGAAAWPTPEHAASDPRTCHAGDAHTDAPRQCAPNPPRDGAVLAADLAVITAAPAGPSVAAGTPCVRAAALLPHGNSPAPPVHAAAAAASRSTSGAPQPRQTYLAYFLSDTSPSRGREAPSSMWGVYAHDTKACLQVVHWSAVTGGAPPAAGRELLMHVDADGHCFVLSTDTLVSTHGSHDSSSSNGPGDAAAVAAAHSLPSSTPLTPGLHAASPHSADAYWLVPSLLVNDFLALLQARVWLRTTAALPAPDAPCPGWRVQPHPTRWVPPLLHPERGGAAGDVAAAAAALAERASSPRRPTSKTRKAAARAVRPAPLPVEAVAQPPPVTAPGLPDVSPYRIPYVAAVECASCLGVHPLATAEALPPPPPRSADAVLLVGNVLRAYPAAAM